MVGPIQDHVARGTIQGLEGAARGLGEAEGSQARLQVFKFSLQIGLGIIDIGDVVRMSEHLYQAVPGSANGTMEAVRVHTPRDAKLSWVAPVELDAGGIAERTCLDVGVKVLKRVSGVLDQAGQSIFASQNLLKDA